MFSLVGGLHLICGQLTTVQMSSLASSTNTALCAFNFLLDGDVKLKIPDFIVHQLDLEHANVEASDDEIEL